MFEELSRIWNKYGWEIMVTCSLIILLILFLFFRSGNGSYATQYYDFSPPIRRHNYSKNSKPYAHPKESCDTQSQGRDSEGERICRQVLQQIFNKSFSKARPEFLKNPITGLNLELDMWNPEMKLACEYNGCQHYKFVKFFHGTMDNFRNSQYRDYLKKDMCNKAGVRLLEVPDTVKNKDIEGYIRVKLSEMGYKVSN